jgi:hypothetical protein
MRGRGTEWNLSPMTTLFQEARWLRYANLGKLHGELGYQGSVRACVSAVAVKNFQKSGTEFSKFYFLGLVIFLEPFKRTH